MFYAPGSTILVLRPLFYGPGSKTKLQGGVRTLRGLPGTGSGLNLDQDPNQVSPAVHFSLSATCSDPQQSLRRSAARLELELICWLRRRTVAPFAAFRVQRTLRNATLH